MTDATRSSAELVGVNAKKLARAPLVRLNAISPYFTMYPLTFPLNALKHGQRGQWVLDPFCGRGTTNFAARLMQCNTVGIDSNPVATAIASAKLVHVRPERVQELCRQIIENSDAVEVPEGEFWSLCYHPQTLLDICKLREYFLRHCDTPEEIALRAAVMGILHGPVNKGRPTYLSNQMPRTYATKPAAAVRFWNKRGLEPTYVDVVDTVTRRVQYVFEQLPDPVAGQIILSDSVIFDYRNLGQKFHWVVTSPPYFGMRTYIPDQWLRYWFIGGPPDVTYVAESQLGRKSQEEFVEGLRSVWTGIASSCVLGAQLVIRFGTLPSHHTDALTLLKHSLRDTPWKIRSICSAGSASRGRRQADQFGFVRSKAVDEIDLIALLEE
jgi:hypothetical protein